MLHIKVFAFYNLVDAFSVSILAIAFTFLAIKTRSLWPSTIFHFLHNKFVLFATSGTNQPLNNWGMIVLFGPIWIGVGIAILSTGRLIKRFQIIGNRNIYGLSDISQDEEKTKIKSK